MPASAELSPVSSTERFFDSARFTALWASLALGAPALLLGVTLGTAEVDGGLGLSIGQLAFVIPLGAVIGAGALAAIGWMGSDVGVPSGLLLRPAFGIGGSWLAAMAIASLYLVWGAVEIQIGALLLERLLSGFDVTLSDTWTIVVVALGVAGLLTAGMARVAGLWIRRFAIWAALLALGAILWKTTELAGTVDLANRVPTQGSFWPGVDAVLLVMMIWLPLAADTGRFTKSTTIAVSGVGFAFGVGTAALLLSGGFVGIVAPVAATEAGLLAFFVEGVGFAGLLLLGLWLFAGEMDQPFGFIYGAATNLFSIFLRRSPLWLMFIVVAAAGAGAMFLDEANLLASGQLLAGLVAVVFSIAAADFYLVRKKRYLADGLYQRGGFYKGVNLIGLATLVGSFGLQQWIKPVGPELWLDAAVDLVPGMGTWSAEYGVPAVLVSMVVAFGLYAVMGRWWIAEWESVARLRI